MSRPRLLPHWHQHWRSLVEYNCFPNAYRSLEICASLSKCFLGVSASSYSVSLKQKMFMHLCWLTYYISMELTLVLATLLEYTILNGRSSCWNICYSHWLAQTWHSHHFISSVKSTSCWMQVRVRTTADRDCNLFCPNLGLTALTKIRSTSKENIMRRCKAVC